MKKKEEKKVHDIPEQGTEPAHEEEVIEEGKLEAEVEDAEVQAVDPDEIDSLKMTVARLQADFANFKNRSERERKDMIRLANEGLILKLLPVVDNFERAFAEVDKKEPNIEGFHMIYKELTEILAKEGIKPLESDGEAFDPNLHHALFLEKKEGVEDDVVIETFQKGYKMGDKLIRPAMVKVSKNQ